MMGVSIAWAEQILPWVATVAIAVAALTVIHLWCRADADAWPIHDTRRGDES